MFPMMRFAKLYSPAGDGGGGAAGAGAGGAAGTGDGGAAGAGSGGSAAGAGADGGASGQGGQAQKNGADGGSPTAFRPEGLPDHLYGGSDKETVEKLYGAYKGARETLGQLGEVPKDAKGYAIEWADPVKPYAEGLKDDKFLGKVKEIALKHKVPTKQFSGFLNDVMSEMIAGDMVAEPFDANREIAALAPDVKDPKEAAKAADAIVRGNIALIDAWKEQDMPEAAANFLSSLMDRAAANKLVEWIADRAGEERPALNGHQAGGMTESQLDQMMADPRGDINHPKYDAAFVKQRDQAFQKFYGTGAGRG